VSSVRSRVTDPLRWHVGCSDDRRVIPDFPTTWKGISSHYATAPLRVWHRRRVTAARPIITTTAQWDRWPERWRNWFAHHVFYRTAVGLRGRFPADGPLAPLNAIVQSEWSCTMPTLLYLWRHCQTQRPQRIIEFGSGISTCLFALYAVEMRRRNLHVEVVSLDHEAKWLANTRAMLDRIGIPATIHLLHAPIGEQMVLSRLRPACIASDRELTKLAGADGFDLCLIDGPPKQFGRTGSLVIAAPYLAKQAVVMLDDALRQGERDAMAEWCAAWPQALGEPRLVLADHHGLAVADWTGPGPQTGR
jgi:predicted O-methyltransferase YrrM